MVAILFLLSRAHPILARTPLVLLFTFIGKALPQHFRARGRMHRGERRRGRDVGEARRPRDPVLHAAVLQAVLRLLSVAEDQPLSRDTGHAGTGAHARWHDSF